MKVHATIILPDGTIHENEYEAHSVERSSKGDIRLEGNLRPAQYTTEVGACGLIKHGLVKCESIYVKYDGAERQVKLLTVANPAYAFRA
jgi:hypothetical protein